jgi:hypothetical protein
MSTNRTECRRASAIRFTRTDPRYTEIGGIAELMIPRTEYFTNERGEAAQARAIPWRRFFRTRSALPFVFDGGVSAMTRKGTLAAGHYQQGS